MSQFIEMFGNPLSSKQKNELKRLGQCCIINPRRPNIALCDTDKVSFIPMPAVSEDGYLVDMADEEYGKVKKGFTYFENNDVLFAKITPCMENGKGAIAYGLTNGIGVGSTEFHVLRPINGISSPYWLLTLTRMPIFRERAAKNMSGTGGQKRVSASYLNHFMVGLPAIEEQRRFEAIYRQADKSKFGDFKSQFIEMVGDPRNNPKGWPTKRLSELAEYSIGLTYKPEQICDDGTIVLRSGNIQDGKISFSDIVRVNAPIKESLFVKEDDILMCSRNGSASLVGKVAMIPDINEPMTFGAFMTIIRSAEAKYLYLYFQSQDFRERVSEGKSSTMNQITQKMLDKVEVPFPDKDVREALSAIASQADKSKFGDFKSQFIEMFGTVENNTHNFPIMTIGEFANCFAGATPSTSHPEYWENGRIRWMSSGEVHKGHVEDTDSRITELGYKSASTRMVPIHSIVIAIAGQGKTRGTVAITEVDLCTNQSLCAIVPDERVNYSYLYHNLQGRYLELRGLSGDVNGRGGLNLKIIQKIPVILPPIEKQQQFASIAQQADKSKSVIQKALVYLNDIQSDELRKIA